MCVGVAHSFARRGYNNRCLSCTRAPLQPSRLSPQASYDLLVGILDYHHAWRASIATHTTFPGRDHVSDTLPFVLPPAPHHPAPPRSYSGGRIAGLTLAIALGYFAKHSGNAAPPEVHLYESGPEVTTVGAGISVWPRTWAVMRALGLYDDLALASVQALGGGQGGQDEFSEYRGELFVSLS